MKEQDDRSPSKANSITKDVNNCIEEDITNTEFRTRMVKMINKFKKGTQKLVSD
jgi:hypothetical protein